MDLRKIEHEKPKLNVSLNNISSFVYETAISNFQPLAEKKGILLKTSIDDNITGYIDIDKFDKILFNILSNAIKYTPSEKNVYLSLTSTQQQNGKHILLEIADEGIGIQKKEIDKIFTKFYNNKEQHGYESNGIGLSLTKELISVHRGNIDVKSEPGNGSIFTVKIPIDKETYENHEIVKSSINDKFEEVSYEETKHKESKPTILFIDDNDDLREIVHQIMHRKYNIITSENAQKGFEIIKNNPIDIIICDIMMPEINGLEFCRKIKEEPQHNHIPIIILTAKNTASDQTDSYKAGAESYIAKPFEIKTLQARIENLLDKRKTNQISFRERMDLHISNMEYQNTNDKFLNDAIRCVENHIKNPDFDLDLMSSELNISRSTLTRKCKVIVGRTPWELIRNIRLKYACNILKQNK